MAKKATIAGNTFLFTGKLTEFTREDAEAPPYRYSLDEENGLAVRLLSVLKFCKSII